jgi:hypothetical protein
MENSTHRYLDGELPLDALSPRERAAADRLANVIAAASEQIRHRPVPDLTARVMAALPETPAPVAEPVLQRLLTWLWTPSRLELRLRPAFGMALAAAAVALLMLAPLSLRAPADGGSETSASAAIFVQFRFEAPGASSVSLAGSFTEWEPRVELRQSAPGVWSAMVPLTPGVHDYTFVVDGTEWVPDPHAFAVDDSFGGLNSRITLLRPSSDI